MLGRPSREDESHNTYSLFGGPDRLEPRRAIMLCGRDRKCSQTPDSDSSWSAWIEGDIAPQPVQQDPWKPARKFSEEAATWVPQVGVRHNRLPIFSHFTYEPEVKLSAPNLEGMANGMRLDLPWLVVPSMQTNSFCHQGEGQHTAATAAGTFQGSMAPGNPKPWVSTSPPGNFFSFLLEAEEQVPDNSAKPTERAPLIGSPRRWRSGLNIWGFPSPLSPKRQAPSSFWAQDLEPLRASMMGSLKGRGLQTRDSDSSFSSEMEDEDPWCPARRFSEEGATWVPGDVGPWPNGVSSFSHCFSDPEVTLSAWAPEGKAGSRKLNLAGPEVWSRQAQSFRHQGEGQHTAATAAGTFHGSTGSASSKPWVSTSPPGNFFSFLLEAGEQVPDNSAKPTERAPLIGSPRGWGSGLNIWGFPSPLSPKPQAPSSFWAQDLEPLRASMMGSLNGRGLQTLHSDRSFSSEMEEEDPWCPARRFSEEGATWVPEVGPLSNGASSFSHFLSDPGVRLSAWTPEEKASSRKSKVAGPEVWSMKANSFCQQGEGQHTAATAAGTSRCSVERALPEPRVSLTLPGDFLSFLLEEEEEEEKEEQEEEEDEEEEEEEEQEADNSASLALKTPWIGYPRGWNSGFVNVWQHPPTDPSPEPLTLSRRILSQDSESPPAQPRSSFRPPVFRACRRRLLF